MEALEAAGCARIFTDTVSSRKDVADRPGLVAALDYLREGDTLCVWQLDRLGRSTKEILTIADDLHSRGVGLRILAGTLVGDYQPKLAAAKARRDRGENPTEIARALGVSRASVYRHLAAESD